MNNLQSIQTYFADTYGYNPLDPTSYPCIYSEFNALMEDALQQMFFLSCFYPVPETRSLCEFFASRMLSPIHADADPFTGTLHIYDRNTVIYTYHGFSRMDSIHNPIYKL